MICKSIVFKAMLSKIGIRFLMIILPGIIISMGFLIYFATGLVADFGEYSASINEDNIRAKTNLFMSRFMDEQVMRYENTFQKIALSSALIAEQASNLFEHSNYIVNNPSIEKDVLTFFPESGSFSNGPTEKTSVLYWGSTFISKEIEHQLKVLSNIDPMLIKVKENNLESVAVFIVTKSAILRYYPNLYLVKKIKPLKDYDLRNGIWYRMAKPENNPSHSTAWTKVYQDEAGQGLMITSISPVYGSSGEYLGVAGIDITLNNIIDKILGGGRYRQKFDNMGGMFSFILDNKGNIIAFPENYAEKFGIKVKNRGNMAHYGDVVSYGLKDSRFAEVRTIGDSIIDKNKQIETIVLSGESFFISSQIMPSTGWRLCIVIPEAFIMASVDDTRNAIDLVVKKMNFRFTVITSALLIFYVLVIIVFLSRQMIIPLHKLTQAASQVKEGDLTVNLNIQRKDEIGLLIRTFNNMVHELYTSSIREKEHTKILEDTVHERTKEIIQKNKEQANTLRVLKTEFKNRTKIQSKLRESQEKYRDIFENSVEGIFQSNLDDRLLSANPAMARILGYDSSEEVIKDISNLSDQLYVNPEERKKFIQVLEKEKSVSGFEVQFLRKDGSIIWVSLSARAVMDSKGSLLYILGSIEDITQRRQAEEGFKIATKIAQDANRAKDEFLATMSHEIRTPMNAILGMTEMVLNTRLGQDQKKNLEVVYKSAQHLLSLINDILDFSRIEAGKLAIEYAPFNLDTLLKDVVGMLSYKAESKDLKLSCNLDDIPIFLKGDESRLRQIMVNLVNNAIKFTDEGEINISVQYLNDDDNGPDTEIESSKLKFLFSIKDTGIGIPQEKLNIIFDLFTQLDGSFKRSYGGTGLGLAISKKLVNLMGGHIWVESEVQKGSEFMFTMSFFPATKNEIYAIKNSSFLISKSPQFIKPRSRFHILVAEDFEVNQDVITPLLENCGYQVTIVENGREAIEAVKQDCYDLILMDIQMPIMDGLEATLHIRAIEDPKKASIPIIALTAHAMPEHRLQCISAGMNDYLQKPLKINELIKSIEAVSQIKESILSIGMSGENADKQTDMIHALELMDGEKKLLSIGCNSIIKYIPQHLIRLKEAVSAGNSQTAERFAHTIKTAAKSVGASKLSETALLIEQFGNKKQIQEAEPIISILEDQLKEVVKELQEYLLNQES